MKAKGESKSLSWCIKRERDSFLDMFDLLFRFQFLSWESNQKALAFSQCEDKAPRTSK